MGIVRLSHYPAAACEENQFNASPHIDGDFITFLAQSEVPGLDLRTSEKKWIQAPVLSGTFLVNAGEILRLWSNDRFRATFHRVINQSDRERGRCFKGPTPIRASMTRRIFGGRVLSLAVLRLQPPLGYRRADFVETGHIRRTAL